MPDLSKRIRSGGCQCGALRYAVMSEPTHTSICWCRMCQKASGNYFQAFSGVPRADFVDPGATRYLPLVGSRRTRLLP